MKGAAILVLLAIAATPALAGEPETDALVRDLSPDRPWRTASPVTLDAGRVQLEVAFFRFGRDRDLPGLSNIRLRVFDLVPFNLRIGVLENVDLQLGFQPLIFRRTEMFDPTTSVEQEGVGDVLLRAKVNLWGNGQGENALAVLPFLKIPTNQEEIGNNSIEGGVRVPFAQQLGEVWHLGAQLGVDAVRNLADDGHTVGLVQSVVVRRAVWRRIDGYIEVFSSIPAESGARWLGIFPVTEDVRIDVGAELGLSDAAVDSVIFVGGTFRF